MIILRQKWFSKTKEDGSKKNIDIASPSIGVAGTAGSVIGGMYLGGKKQGKLATAANREYGNGRDKTLKDWKTAHNEIIEKAQKELEQLDSELKAKTAGKGLEEYVTASKEMKYGDRLNDIGKRRNSALDRVLKERKLADEKLEEEAREKINNAIKAGKKTRNKVIAAGLVATGAAVGTSRYLHNKHKKQNENSKN